jgi:hypothetical protein
MLDQEAMDAADDSEMRERDQMNLPRDFECLANRDRET